MYLALDCLLALKGGVSCMSDVFAMPFAIRRCCCMDVFAFFLTTCCTSTKSVLLTAVHIHSRSMLAQNLTRHHDQTLRTPRYPRSPPALPWNTHRPHTIPRLHPLNVSSRHTPRDTTLLHIRPPIALIFLDQHQPLSLTNTMFPLPSRLIRIQRLDILQFLRATLWRDCRAFLAAT